MESAFEINMNFDGTTAVVRAAKIQFHLIQRNLNRFRTSRGFAINNASTCSWRGRERKLFSNIFVQRLGKYRPTTQCFTIWKIRLQIEFDSSIFIFLFLVRRNWLVWKALFKSVWLDRLRAMRLFERRSWDSALWARLSEALYSPAGRSSSSSASKSSSRPSRGVNDDSLPRWPRCIPLPGKSST